MVLTANYPTSIANIIEAHAWDLPGVRGRRVRGMWVGGRRARGGSVETGNMRAVSGQGGIREAGYGTVRATREKRAIVEESVDVLLLASGKNKPSGQLACHRRVKSQY